MSRGSIEYDRVADRDRQPSPDERRYARNRTIMWALFALLLVLHHDWWFWNDGRLVLGFLPIGLAYQMLISLAAGALWGWAAWNAWPPEMESQS
jgi:hypothetical protein